MTLSRISDLPHALRDGQQLAQHLDSRQPPVFLDYNGTLTPIVDRPEDAGKAGISVVVADVGNPEQAGRTTAADFVLASIGEVQQFLNTLAR